MWLIGFPLLIIPFAIYNIIAFLMPGVAWNVPATTVVMVSGAEWAMTPGAWLVCLAVLMLLFEMIKATRTSQRSIVDHALSLILFLGMMVEFILVPRAATATFFILLVIAFVDVVGGFAVSLRTAQRDLTIEGHDRLVS
ncbi:MAG: hypothetical protein AB7O50_12595 [Pseudolabrys sp.]